MTNDELKVLRMRLKSGEYDGTHIMQAWVAIDELIVAKTKLKELENVMIENNEYLNKEEMA